MPLRPRKRLGQHFLHDPAVIGKILAAITPRTDDLMVEIGGGRGALTMPLLEHLEQLHVIELDDRLAGQLLESCPAPERLHLHRLDALKFDFSSLAHGPASLRVVGNLPYNISTPLIFHLLRHRATISDMHLMLQKEVATRMTAAPGSKDYGRLTVALALWVELETCFHVGPGAFNPPPKVWSTVVRLKPQSEPRFAVKDPESFSALVARAFSMRRKTLARSLKGWLEPEQIAQADIDPRARPETLTPEQFATLSNLR
jgi:16S rRNA (adenine1518-N6/adenine1519-N6)-dimethyltransferase